MTVLQLCSRTSVVALFIAAVMVLDACAAATTVPVVASPSTAPAATHTAPANVPPPTPAAQAAVFRSKDPNTLIYETGLGDPDTLDPALDYETTGGGIIQNTYETLIFYNRDNPNAFVPQLAVEVPNQANGGISADGKTYTFKIRADVQFHNGDPLTPADVAFTFQRGLLQGGNNSPQWLLFQPILGATTSPNNDIADLVDPTGAISASGDYTALQKANTTNLLSACQTVTRAIVADDGAGTVTFNLPQPWGPFLSTLANNWGSIVDKKWIGSNGGWDGDCRTWQNDYSPTSADLNKTKLGSSENGTGPYTLDHWTAGQEVVLTAFAAYWRKDPAWRDGPSGVPRLKTIMITTGITATTQRVADLQAGKADIIDTDSSNFSGDSAQLDAAVGEVCGPAGNCQPSGQANGPLRVYKGLVGIARNDIFFNFNVNVTGGNDYIGSGQLDGNGIPPDFFNDVHVRRAFNYCFDWDAYIKGMFQGEAVQSADVMLPGEIGYSDRDPHYTYDPARCKSEFLAATLKSPNGQSLWDTGFRLTVAYQDGADWRKIPAQILSQRLGQLNPKFIVDLASLPWPTFVDAQLGHKLPVMILGWLEDIHDPHNWVVTYGSGVFAALQSMPAELKSSLGSLVNQGVAETDPARRAAIYKRFNQAYFDAAPTILMAVQANRRYEQRWVQGYYSNPIYASYYFYAISKQ